MLVHKSKPQVMCTLLGFILFLHADDYVSTHAAVPHNVLVAVMLLDAAHYLLRGKGGSGCCSSFLAAASLPQDVLRVLGFCDTGVLL